MTISTVNNDISDNVANTVNTEALTKAELEALVKAEAKAAREAKKEQLRLESVAKLEANRIKAEAKAIAKAEAEAVRAKELEDMKVATLAIEAKELVKSNALIQLLTSLPETILGADSMANTGQNNNLIVSLQQGRSESDYALMGKGVNIDGSDAYIAAIYTITKVHIEGVETFRYKKQGILSEAGTTITIPVIERLIGKSARSFSVESVRANALKKELSKIARIADGERLLNEAKAFL